MTHAQMGLNADMGSRMTERFNVAGALLVKVLRPAGQETRSTPTAPDGFATWACGSP